MDRPCRRDKTKTTVGVRKTSHLWEDVGSQQVLPHVQEMIMKVEDQEAMKLHKQDSSMAEHLKALSSPQKSIESVGEDLEAIRIHGSMHPACL